MEIVYVGDQNPSNRALLISDGEWKRLGKILTKKSDERDAIVASQRLKEKRRQTSKKMVDGWDNTELVIKFYYYFFETIEIIYFGSNRKRK